MSAEPADAATDIPTRFSAESDPEQFAACQRLAEALLPPHRLRALLRAAGTGGPDAALRLPDDVLRGPAVALTDRQVLRLRETRSAPLPPPLLARAASLGAWAVTGDDAAFFANLSPLGDAPALLFVRGSLAAADNGSVAVVGSRRATVYGRGQADRFARALAERNIPVISGGAAGIDTAAHRAALEAGGRTVAVLGCGIDISYPAENRMLFDRIAERGGAVISEFSMGTTPEPWRFPTRNRVIAGIARLTLVVESPENSGALLTATDAARYGRDVWAVPGSVTDGRSRGCHKLIQEGAGLADAPDDLLGALGHAVSIERTPAPPRPSRAPRPKSVAAPPADAPAALFDADDPPPALPPLSPDETALLAAFGSDPRHLDVAGGAAGLSAPQATVAATLLEMKGAIKRLPGGLYVRP